MAVHDLNRRRKPPHQPTPDETDRIRQLLAHTRNQLNATPCPPECPHCTKEPTP